MALIPPQYLDTVVAVGVGDDPAKRDWIGTGFLFGRKAVQEGQYHLFLVTNRHVLVGKKKIYLKFNDTTGATSRDYPVDLFFRNGKPAWVPHPDSDVDVGAFYISAKVLKAGGHKYFVFAGDVVANVARMKDIGVTEGDGVFVLGFPMGMVMPDQQYVICRTGCVARIRDVLEGTASNFLIDAIVFPGNSGGPVVLKPELIAIQGTERNPQAYLIGIVHAYVPYIDVAVSEQTGRARITFEDNSGLSSVVPVDRIEETVEIAYKRMMRNVAKHKRNLAKQQGGTT